MAQPRGVPAKPRSAPARPENLPDESLDEAPALLRELEDQGTRRGVNSTKDRACLVSLPLALAVVDLTGGSCPRLPGSCSCHPAGTLPTPGAARPRTCSLCHQLPTGE